MPFAERVREFNPASPAEKLREARRILVIGAGGSGKSTLASRLGETLGVEVIHLDQHYWKSGWIETPREEWESLVRKLTTGDSWIMDGNYSGTLGLRLAAADAVIFLDLPRRLYLRRVLARRLRHRGFSRPDMTPGCPERVTWEFLKYLWKYPAERRPGILAKLGEVSQEKAVFVLRSPEEVRRLVSGLILEPTATQTARI